MNNIVIGERVFLDDIIAPSFHGLHRDIKKHRYTHYWLKGGRGSTKSSLISEEIILGIMKDANNGIMSNGVALRKVGLNLKDSVYEQLIWSIEALKVGHLWEPKISPLTLTYIPTGQKILFRGADKPKKIKSIKFSKGYCKYAWYEELDEFNGMEEIRTINQSLMRGGPEFFIFYSYNPPISIRSWVNEECIIENPDRIVHHSTYLTVPRDWLGEQFILEAEHLRSVNKKAYDHEYCGEVTGTGGEIFTNVSIRTITDEEIAMFDHVSRGIDWGYAVDPFHYTVNHYDKTRKKLYIFYEHQQVNFSNRKAAELIKEENILNHMITCDSAEPKSISEMKDYGLRVVGAKKGPDSVEYGIKWLQDMEEIIIDIKRCPCTAKEFLNYELEKDLSGNFKSGYPDKNNHSIDAIRYSREADMKNRTIKWLNGMT